MAAPTYMYRVTCITAVCDWQYRKPWFQSGTHIQLVKLSQGIQLVKLSQRILHTIQHEHQSVQHNGCTGTPRETSRTGL